jgi:small subunit ribosomal protein S20
MANTRQSAKRARQAKTRQARNTVVRSVTRTILKTAIEALRERDGEKAKQAYLAAVKALSKAASKGSIPKGRAARKISRLTHLAKKHGASPAAAAKR